MSDKFPNLPFNFGDETRQFLGFILERFLEILHGLKKNALSFTGFVIIAFFALIAILAPVLAPPTSENPYLIPYYGPVTEIEITPLPTPPSPEHPFGTLAGYDLYYGCIWGTRTAFIIGLMVVLAELFIGLIMGGIAGYFGGIVDEILMRITDIFFAFPGILLVILLTVALPNEFPVNLGPLSFSIVVSSIEKLAIALAITGWPMYARLIRGEIIRVKNEDYIEAARAIGCSNFRIIFRHMLPNAIFPVFVMAFLDVGGATLSVATLSFLGFGPKRGYAEWGSLISMSRSSIFRSPQEPFKYLYTLLFPMSFVSAFVLGWSLIGDALRNILDPMIRRR